jgi:hypothetical protein
METVKAPTMPPLKYVAAAVLQWFGVGFLLGITVLLTYFPMGFLVILTAKHTTNAHGETVADHDQKYIDLGSSGKWEFWASAWRFISRWNNYEDGLRGEPSGKNSAACGGKEATFWNQYSWLCRNSYNQGKRLSRFFACYVNDCIIESWGTGDVSDKEPVKDGWYFIRATDKITGRVYYGYRYVVANERNAGIRLVIVKSMMAVGNFMAKLFGGKKRVIEGTVYNAVFGYKIKPSHATTVQDADDLDKAFTARVQFASTPD